MAALANVKVRFLITKSSLVVVARRTALRPRGRIMLRGQSGADLSCLWQPLSSQIMTTVAGEARARGMIGVVEAEEISAGCSRSRRVRTARVTIAAGRGLACGVLGRVARVTTFVSFRPPRDGHGNAATRLRMTCRATFRRPRRFDSSHVLCVIELRGEGG